MNGITWIRADIELHNHGVCSVSVHSVYIFGFVYSLYFNKIIFQVYNACSSTIFILDGKLIDNQKKKQLHSPFMIEEPLTDSYDSSSSSIH